jgi:preprotein translocase subunit SecE
MANLRETYGRVAPFFREVRAELKRVTWPTRKETVGSTSVVLILVMIMAVFFGLVDMGLHAIIRRILS